MSSALTVNRVVEMCRGGDSQGWDGGGSGDGGHSSCHPKGLRGSQEHRLWEAERKSMEGCPAVVTHICLIPEARNTEGLQ